MTRTNTLPLFTAEASMVTITQYGVRLVRENEFKYASRKINGAEAVCDLLRTIGLHEKATEEFYGIYLSTKNDVIGIEMISRGTLNASLVHPREVFKGAILANANALILAHNHPSGNVEPSNADKQVTALLVNAGNILDVKILDHVIIGSKGGHYSFRDHSLI
jgi:DNA repair protein RadC